MDKNIELGEAMRTVLISRGFDSFKEKTDDIIAQFEERYGAGKNRLDALTAIMSLAFVSMVEGLAAFGELERIVLSKSPSESFDDMCKFVDDMVDEAIDVALDFPNVFNVEDFYNGIEDRELLVSVDGGVLTDDVIRRVADETGAPIDVIKHGKLIFGSAGACNELINDIIKCADTYDNFSDKSCNDMLEAARKARGV